MLGITLRKLVQLATIRNVPTRLGHIVSTFPLGNCYDGGPDRQRRHKTTKEPEFSCCERYYSFVREQYRNPEALLSSVF